MKKLTLIVTVVLALSALPALADGAKTEVRDPAKLIPPMQLGDKLTLKLWGFSQGAFVENAAPDEFQWTSLRLLGSFDRERLGLGFVFNFADLQNPNSNWVRELYGKFKLTDTLEARVGRILHSAGYGEGFPGPPANETVLFPKCLQFGQYGTGLQLRWKRQLWSVVADATGNSAPAFDDPESLKHLEFSGRIKRSFVSQKRELGYLGGSVQLTKDVGRFGFDGQWQPVKELTLRGGAFYARYASQKHSDCLGAFALVAHRPVRWLELHTMLDGTVDLQKEYQVTQKQKDKQGNVTYKTVTQQTSDDVMITWTYGLRFLGQDDCWSLTLDYEQGLADNKTDRALARFHVQF